VINAERVKLTGNKMDQKIYRHHSGYPGGLKEIPIRVMLQRRPEEVVREAVLGMLPKNKLRARRAKKLRVYAGSEALARHAGQKPQPLAL
jgi:large subunit ribosomal protein L13